MAKLFIRIMFDIQYYETEVKLYLSINICSRNRFLKRSFTEMAEI